MPHFTVGKNIASETLYDLVDFDVRLTVFAVDYLERFHKRSELLPLMSPVGAARPPSDALGQLTFSVISERTPSMSRSLKAEYAFAINVWSSTITPP
jgi:hypothetical protein